MQPWVVSHTVCGIRDLFSQLHEGGGEKYSSTAGAPFGTGTSVVGLIIVMDVIVVISVEDCVNIKMSVI